MISLFPQQKTKLPAKGGPSWLLLPLLSLFLFLGIAHASSAATLTASPATLSPGGEVTVTFTAIPSPTGGEMIAMYAPSIDPSAPQDWFYASSCNKSGGSPKAAGSCAYRMPTYPTSYYFRLFTDTAQSGLLATSNTVVLSTAPTPTPTPTPTSATLTASPTSVSSGGTITVSWAGVSSPTVSDWISLFTQGTPDGGTRVNWTYDSSTPCTQAPGATPKSSGSCTFTMPTTAGTYEFRLFANNSYTRLATPVTVTVTASTNLSHTVYDFNGDGKSDILWRHSSGLVHEWLLDGISKIGANNVGSPDNT